MIRIKFDTEKDHIDGNYLLATNTVVRVLRGRIFEIAKRDRKLLDDHQLRYTVLPIPEPNGSTDTLRNPPSVEF
ncbi:MAG: hypothetical protein L0Y71_03450 [Gemmataceae bacterium]|nr:hypothetical protein [Gemmataceae bacterium]